MEAPAFKLNGRVWIETGDEKVLGHGRVELLERISASGSIRQAALQMKMSYKQAWVLIHHMNTHFGTPLVTSQRGGKGGGHALVTPAGLKLMEEFYAIQKKFNKFLQAYQDLELP